MQASCMKEHTKNKKINNWKNYTDKIKTDKQKEKIRKKH